MVGKFLGRARPRKPHLEDINHRIQIVKCCHMKGAALDKREWLRLQEIAFELIIKGLPTDLDYYSRRAMSYVISVIDA